jgi:hypothetical protein
MKPRSRPSRLASPDSSAPGRSRRVRWKTTCRVLAVTIDGLPGRPLAARETRPSRSRCRWSATNWCMCSAASARAAAGADGCRRLPRRGRRAPWNRGRRLHLATEKPNLLPRSSRPQQRQKATRSRLPPVPGPQRPELGDRKRQIASIYAWVQVASGEHRFAPRPIESVQPPEIQQSWKRGRCSNGTMSHGREPVKGWLAVNGRSRTASPSLPA